MIVGERHLTREEALRRWYRHLDAELALPCDVTGAEDFRWEEFYALGPGSSLEYQALRREQPSYQDVFELMYIDRGGASEWSLFYEDLNAHVRRTSDGKGFLLSLSELEAVDKSGQNHQLLTDYAVWFVNSR